jgi:hypothetical protein
VQLRDVVVQVGAGRTDATAQIVVSAQVDGRDEGFILEFKLRLVREGRAWRICRVDPVRSLRM